MNNRLTNLLLLIILILSLILRIYKLDSVPPSISWDEATVGYNAWTIANFGRDEYGKLLPLYFHSFGDDKSPVHIYFTAISVALLGLSEFSTRLPSAIFGVFNVLLIFYLGKVMFRSNALGLIAASFMAISPFSLQFSRFNHESNFALFFFMLGMLLFFKAVYQKSVLLPFSAISFCVSFISYHSPKVIVPLMIVILSILYHSQLWKIKKLLLISMTILILFAVFIYLNPSLTGFARAKQTSLPESGKGILGKIELSFQRYLSYFSKEYLFIKGDPIPRHSTQAVGEFYKIDLLFLLFGALFLLSKKSKASFTLACWAFLAPLPAAIVGGFSEISHAARASFMMGSWHLISALGLYFVISLVKKPILKAVTISVTIIILALSLWNYLSYYYGEYAKRYAIEWQYGMKQIVEYVKENPKYSQIFMTDARAQPYIFFLYYLKYPLPEYLNSVLYNNSESKSYNNVSNFGRYYFGGWDSVESFPHPNVLYVVTPSQYDGLRHKGVFDVKKLIKYPNGVDAFYLVSAK